MSPSWELYERWCFVRIARELRQLLPNLYWTRIRHPDCWRGTSPDTIIELSLQPTFAAGNQRPGPWSVSRERVPDILLSRRRGSGVRFVVFDAKYRATRWNVRDATAAVHVYQDSLRIGPNAAGHVAAARAIRDGAPWMESVQFQEEHRVGVVPMFAADDASFQKAYAAGWTLRHRRLCEETP
jgi:hypothetical protein